MKKSSKSSDFKENDKNKNELDDIRQPDKNNVTSKDPNIQDNESSEFRGSFGEEEPEVEDEKSNEMMLSKRNKPEKKRLLRGPEISLLDLNDPGLQAVYNGEQEELISELAKCKQINDNGKAFKYALTMCFWLSMHLEKTKMIPFIYEQDSWLK